jgi:RNA polymerase sigma factor for flagellar operon FliA
VIVDVDALMGADVSGGISESDIQQLITDNLDIVQHVVNQVSVRYPKHVDRQELWSAGACGLVEAARRYRPETGVPFARYAQTRIRGAIIDSTRSRDWAVRAVRRNLRELRAAEETFEETHGRSAADGELAALLGIDADELNARKAAAVSASLLHLDHQYPDQESLGEALPEMDVQSLPEENFTRREMLGTLRTAIDFLPPTQRDVVERYYLNGEMLQDIAASMGVTEARVSQVASEAINAIRAYMRQLYDGVPEVPENAPGKRNRAAYLGTMSTHSTWRGRLEAADEPGWEEFARLA